MTGWERAAPLVAQALKYQDEHDLDYVKREIEERRAQLWHGRNAVIVTRIKEKASGRICVIWLAGGPKHMRELVEEMLPAVEAWAKENDCVKVVIVGRKGWARKLRGLYRVTHMVMERLL